MSSEEELFAKLDRWLELQPAEPTIFKVVQTADAELFAAYVLRHFRAAAKEAVADRLTREAGKLRKETWERAGAIGTLVGWLSVTWRLSVTEQVTLLGLADEAELASMRPASAGRLSRTAGAAGDALGHLPGAGLTATGARRG